MRPSQQARIQAEIDARIAKGQAMLDALERQTSPQPAQPEATPQMRPPAQPRRRQDTGLDWRTSEQAQRGKYQGGRSRIVGWFFPKVAYLMADESLSFRAAVAKLGLTLSEHDIKRIPKLLEFRRLRRAYKRLYQSDAWGQPNADEVLEKLMILENRRKPPRKPKPMGSRYISHARR